MHQSEIARLVPTQMQQHFWSGAPGDCDVSIRGSTLKPVTYTAADEVPLDFRCLRLTGGHRGAYTVDFGAAATIQKVK